MSDKVNMVAITEDRFDELRRFEKIAGAKQTFSERMVADGARSIRLLDELRIKFEALKEERCYDKCNLLVRTQDERDKLKQCIHEVEQDLKQSLALDDEYSPAAKSALAVIARWRENTNREVKL